MTDLSKAGDTLGYSALIPDNSSSNYLHNQRIGKVIIKSDCIDKEYLYWLMRSPNYQKFIVSTSSGTTVKHTSPKSILKYAFSLPPLLIQRSIAATLSCLDDKIELNNRINANLEAQAQTIFKSWFVDFEPFRDGEFVDSELGRNPKGWKIKKIGDLCKSVSKTHDFEKNKLIFLNTGDIENGKFLHTNYSDIRYMPGQAKKSIQKNDILFSEIRPMNKHFAFVNLESRDYVVSTKLMVIRTDKIDSRRLYHYLTTDDSLRHLQTEAESRSGTFPQIRFENIQRMDIIIATKNIEEEFAQLLNIVYGQIDSNIAQNDCLATIRDILLPKLMSGEISVDKTLGEF
jgi:type I restriction enzyme S subunit